MEVDNQGRCCPWRWWHDVADVLLDDDHDVVEQQEQEEACEADDDDDDDDDEDTRRAAVEGKQSKAKVSSTAMMTTERLQ